MKITTEKVCGGVWTATGIYAQFMGNHGVMYFSIGAAIAWQIADRIIRAIEAAS